jgi:rubrerythrin
MLSTNLLKSLSRLPSPLLTAYVRTTPDQAALQGAAPRYLHLLKEKGRSLAESLESPDRDSFSRQLERVMEFLSKPKSHGSMVFFAGPSVWEVVPLQTEVKDELRWGRPSLAQLIWLTGEHKQYGLVAVDHKGARFFLCSMGEIVEGQEKKFNVDISGWRKKDLGKVMGEGVAKTHGTQRDDFDKRLDNQFLRLCREAAQQAAAFFPAKDLAAIFLLGPDKLTTAMEAKFPRIFRLPIVRIDQEIARLTPAALLGHLAPRVSDWEREHQKTLVHAISGNERGTIRGLDETLTQLQRGQVRTLVLAWDFDVAIHQCRECSWKGRCADRVCPVCEGQTGESTLRDLLPEILLKHTVELEIVSGEAAERLMQMGGMAGWLRQKKLQATAGA